MSISYSYSANQSQDEHKKKKEMTARTEVSSSSHYVSPLMTSTSSRKATSVAPLRRIRKPHAHDVLCGRGGGINSHPGNITFRTWVRERKEAYNLAHTKVAKTNVSREILDRVASLKPPGRFLQREEVDKGPGIKSSQFWVEIDDIKAMAKTSQALREGAPAIRAKAKVSTDRTCHKRSSVKKTLSPEPQARSPGLTPQEGRTRRLPDNEKEQAQRSPIRRKLNVQDKDLSTSNRISDFSIQEYNIDYNDGNGNSSALDVKMTEEEKMERIALSSIPIIEQFPLGNIEMQNPIPDNKDTSDTSGTLDNTPNLLPIPDPSDPPNLNAFPLPPSSLSSEPLSPVFATFRSFTGRPFSEKMLNQSYNKNTIGFMKNDSKKMLVRSHSLALSDLPDPDITGKSYSHQESILNEDSSTFKDPFQNEEEDYLNKFVEGNPNFSATRICNDVKNVSPSPIVRNRSLSRSLSHSNSTIRSSSMSLLVGNDEIHSIQNKFNVAGEKKSVCFCNCDGHDGACKELCPCTHLANSLLTGELKL